MSKRLEITLHGVEFTVGMIRLNPTMIKAGMDLYGSRKWNRMVNTFALDPKAKKKADEVAHTLGHPFKIEYRQTGIMLQGREFGMEVFWGNDFFPIDTVESQNRTLHPDKLMQDYKSQEMLSVFWGRRNGVMAFHWDGVKKLSQEEIELSYDSLTTALARKRALDIVTNVTLKGKKGKLKKMEPLGEFEIQKHVFHRKN